MEDLGPEAVKKSAGLAELARCQPNKSERDCKRVLVNKFQLSMPIEKSFLETGDESLQIPVLRLRSWAEFLLKNNCWHVVTGLIRPNRQREEHILGAFWEKYRQQSPNHPVFQMALEKRLVLCRTCPVVMHGDEGRGRKHQAFMVLNFHSLLGRGLNAANRHEKIRGVKKHYLKMLPNYKGHSYTTRFLLAALRKKEYTGDNEHAWDSLMSLAASEAHFMATEGVRDESGRQHWMMMLHIVGDWPFLHKSGVFSRSFNNALKRLDQKEVVGICHQCSAGRENVPGQCDVPFEQINTRRPLWLSTEFQEGPSEWPSPFQIVPHTEGKFGELWAFDIFHCWHLGLSRNLLGGALALLSEQMSAGNVDDRFAELSAHYKQWCEANKLCARIQKLTKECISWPTTSSFPVGSWHKGDLSTVLMKFLEAFLIEHDFPDEPLLKLVKEAAVSINAAIRILYHGQLWLSPDECRAAAENGLRFLRRYSQLTIESYHRSKNLFMLPPKAHVIQKLFIRLLNSAECGISHLNLLATATQQDEDFIGRPSRLARRVTGRNPASARVVDRYLLACYAHWVDAGYLVRPV